MGNGPQSYTSLLVHLLVVSLGVGGLLTAATFLGPRRPTRPKDLPYESGTQTPGSARQRFSVHFYLIAMLFILFDVEAVFLFSWAVTAPALGITGFWVVLVFVTVLGVGLGYAWRKGALSWH